MSKSHYLAYYGEASRKIETANDILVNNTTAENLKNEKIADLQNQLQVQRDELMNFEKTFSNTHVLQEYSEHHKNLWLYNKCCGLDENQGYNIYFFAH